MQDSIRVALETVKQDLEDELEEESQRNLPQAIDGLTADHFPCFLTVKKLIYMLDASLSHPFFSRSIDGKIYGMDSSTEWHCENKQGTFMINQYHKDAYDFTKKLKKLGRKLIKAEDMEEEEKLKKLEEAEKEIKEAEKKAKKKKKKGKGKEGSFWIFNILFLRRIKYIFAFLY